MTFRRALFWMHLGMGVSLGLVIASMCATGTLLAFEPQLTAWSERDVATIIPPHPLTARLRIDQILAQLQQQEPDAHPSMVTFKADPAATVLVGLGRNGVLFLNPYTGTVVGQGSTIRRKLRSVEEWHRWLGNRKIGQPITCVAAIAFFLLTLSGVYLWWPRHLFSPRAAHPNIQAWTWHNAIGFWLSPVALIITLTGFMMASGVTGKGAGGKAHGTPVEQTGWTSMTFRLPQRPGQTMSVSTQPSSHPRPWQSWITPLHTGRAWGWPGQTLNFLFAIAGLLQIATGFILAYRRFRRRT